MRVYRVFSPVFISLSIVAVVVLTLSLGHARGQTHPRHDPAIRSAASDAAPMPRVINGSTGALKRLETFLTQHSPAYRQAG